MNRRTVSLGLALLVLALGCGQPPPPAPAAPQAVALIVSGDTAGWIVPCGCTTNQSGGLPRRGTYVQKAAAQGPVLMADVGGAAAGTSPYHRVKFEAILQGEKQMGLAAHNLGASEVALGPDYLREVAGRLRVPIVSANVKDAAGQPVAPPLVIAERGGRRIALAGVLSRRFATAAVQVEEPREALLKALPAYRGQYDSLIVLAYLPGDDLDALAAGLPEADAVLGGPTGQSIMPRRTGPTLVAAATNKGKFLIHLDSGTGPHPAWSGKVVELDTAHADDAAQVANVQAYLAELGRRDFAAADTGFAPPLPATPPQGFRVAGNATCTGCHKNDCTLFEGSHHAHAWQTLEGKGYQVDGYCQQCHSTGFGLPGGFVSAARSKPLGGVGCESCHGPSEAHVQEPKVRTPFPAKDQCARCHDHENSPKFEYAGYWDKIRHGAK
jgi:hypothetical protein